MKHKLSVPIALTCLALMGACSAGERARKANSGAAGGSSSAEQAWQKAQEQQICAEVTPRDCYFQGMKLEAAQKSKQAMRYFEAACERDLMSACYDLAVIYESGEAVPEDLDKAKSLYEEACHAQKKPDATACNNLAVMYQKASGVQADQKKAAELYGRGCEQGSMLACRNLARRYVEGNGVERDPAKAADLLDRACTLGHPEACPQLTYLYAHDCLDGGECDGDATDPDKSVDALREVCEQGEQPQACLGHGFMIEAGFGGHEADAAKAALHYDTACKGGVSAACNY